MLYKAVSICKVMLIMSNTTYNRGSFKLFYVKKYRFVLPTQFVT